MRRLGCGLWGGDDELGAVMIARRAEQALKTPTITLSQLRHRITQNTTPPHPAPPTHPRHHPRWLTYSHIGCRFAPGAPGVNSRCSDTLRAAWLLVGPAPASGPPGGPATPPPPSAMIIAATEAETVSGADPGGAPPGVLRGTTQAHSGGPLALAAESGT